VKLIRVNMNDQTTGIEEVPDEYLGLGGRGLSATIINAEVPPKCDPLGPENKLIFAPGLLSGSPLGNTSRISIGAKSPLTGTIKESNVGGTISAALGRLGIAAVVVEGQALDGELYFLRIDETGEARLVSAQANRGKRTYKLVEEILEAYGEKNSVLCIGPAGEAGLIAASIQSSDVEGRPCRAAGRGGLGAVMGAKGLKALIVDQRGKGVKPVADPEAFKEANRAYIKIIKEHPEPGHLMPALGTAALVAPVNSMRAFPCYNARKGVMDDWEKISGETMAELIKERGGDPTHAGCAQCFIQCSNIFVDPGGQYVTSSLEYETIWATGGMTGIADLDTIARLDYLCDDIGVDTMSTGVAIAVAMDAGYRECGDAEAAIELVEEIGKGTEFGKLLGSGPAVVGKHFGHDRVPVVKGQGVAGFDPRAMRGNGVTFATSPMGADHTAGNVVGLCLQGKLDPMDAERAVEVSRNLQITTAAFDSTGLCFMASVALMEPEPQAVFRQAMNAILGTEFGPDDFPRTMGLRVLKAEKEFNRKAGFTNEDDRLPSFYYTEPLPPRDAVFVISDEEMDTTFDF
jgi:aldehyde:ferredoxin oxidoreductase